MAIPSPRGLDSLSSMCIVEYRYISQNTDAITRTLRLNRFDIADSLCYLIDRFSHMLRCKVALHFVNTWDINDLTFNIYWKQRLTDVTFVSRMCCTWLSRTLLAALHVHRIESCERCRAFPERVMVHEFYSLKAWITLEQVITLMVRLTDRVL